MPQVDVFDEAAQPSADGSSGLWWREDFNPIVTVPTVDFILARWPYIDREGNRRGHTPGTPLPGEMMSDSRPAWIGMLRLTRGSSTFRFRLAAEVPYDEQEGRSFLRAGPQFEAAVEASLRLVIRYGTHVVTIAPPVVQADPYSIPIPADQAAALAAMLADMDATAGGGIRVGVALVNATPATLADVSDPAAPTLYVPGVAEIIRALAPRDTLLQALEITHPAISTPARLISDTVEHVIETHRYPAVPFEVTLQDDLEGKVPRAAVRIENVGRAFTEWLERSRGGSGATCRIMLILARDDTVAYEITIGVEEMHVDAQWVQATLGYGSFLSVPAVQRRYDPETFPGLY